MIEKEEITKLVTLHSEGTGLFIVDIQVSASNNIRVLVDKQEGVSLSECITLSKAIEGNLDREKQDFNLEVSSPGLSEPLKVLPQYTKNIGREVEVITKTGQKHTGKLNRLTETGFVIEELVKQKGEKKRPEIKAIEKEFDFNLIQSTKVVVSYK
ncbi:MAG: ribosome assembly cofactor RimP [Bacteroidales bacterium]